MIPEIESICALKKLPFFVTGKNEKGSNVLTFHPDMYYAEIERDWRLATGQRDVSIRELRKGEIGIVPSDHKTSTCNVSHRRPTPEVKPARLLVQKKDIKRKTRRYAKGQQRNVAAAD